MQWPGFSSVVVYIEFMWAELCHFFLLASIPQELHIFIITYDSFDRPIRLVNYHSFYTQFFALPLTGISLEFTYLC